ncbi:AAA family ATPase [Neolewinella antarctica]|uniref:Shikimate kinase n=1 Tax=Neolewinella antarctica TaxID=442734 RepID=A0ABX0X9C7_9BACT|nr:AAA family ATPase [Neolewinella antarctica]NJC25611.1 hypothetical protein [Neolewinella antarctica]
MQLIIITGPPAVGKMTVGMSLADITGFKLFHNHLSIELVNKFFDHGTPAFRRLDKLIRFSFFEEIAASNLPGLIFTYVWAFDDPDDTTYVDEIFQVFQKHGAEVSVVELCADLDTRLVRNRGADRLRLKPSKQDVKSSEKWLLEGELKYRMKSSETEISEKNILSINNNSLTPRQVASEIAKRLNLCASTSST